MPTISRCTARDDLPLHLVVAPMSMIVIPGLWRGKTRKISSANGMADGVDPREIQNDFLASAEARDDPSCGGARDQARGFNRSRA